MDPTEKQEQNERDQRIKEKLQMLKAEHPELAARLQRDRPSLKRYFGY